jgi:hypothetical protein
MFRLTPEVQGSPLVESATSRGPRVLVQCITVIMSCRGHAVTQLVKGLRYKPEGRRFEADVGNRAV